MATRKIEVQITGDADSLERSYRNAARSTAAFDRNISHATRGALAGSGAFHSLGRSIAFASGGFLAFASVGSFLRKSVDAAKEAQVTERQLAAQFRASKQNLGEYQEEIDRTADRLSLLAGFQNDELKASFTTIFRTTGNVSKALRDEATAADLARAKHMGLAQASLIIAKTEAGNTTLLRRQGFQIAKNATATEALAKLRRVVAGQARAGTTEQERFGAVLHNTEEIIGTGILPVLNKYLGAGSRWLTQMNESGRLQKDVTHDMEVFSDAVGTAAGAVKDIDRLTGSFSNTLKIAAGVFLLVKTRAALAWAGMSTDIAAVTAAELGVSTTAATVAQRVALYTGEMSAGWDAVAASAKAATAAEAGAAAGGAAGAAATGVGVGAAAGGAAAGAGGKGFLSRFGGIAGAAAGLAGFFSLGNAGAEVHKVKVVNGRIQTTIGNQAIDLGPAPGVKGSPINPFAGNRFGIGDLGLGGLTRGQKNGIHGATSSAAGAGLSLQGRFNLDELSLAQARASGNTAAQRRILVAERVILKAQAASAKKLKERTAFTEQLAGVEDQIRGIDSAATVAAKKTLKRRKEKKLQGRGDFGESLKLQAASARADAIAGLNPNANGPTNLQMTVAEQVKKAAMKAINSHKLSMQGLIDAWNAVGQANQTLAQKLRGSTATATYRAVSTQSLTRGLGLSRDAQVTLQGRLAQSQAHRGMAPAGIAVQGQVIHVDTVNVHGVRNIDALYSELAKVGHRRSQRRGSR